MSSTQRVAKKWTCDRCGVSAGQIDGAPIALPDAWATSAADGTLCLLCRRDHAASVALESAPSDTSRADRAQLRRSALIEFEVLRNPDDSDGSIAKACRTSVTAVAKARDRLRVPEPV